MDQQIDRLAPFIRRVRAVAVALEVAPAHVAAMLALASFACAGLGALWWVGQRDTMRDAVLAADIAPSGSAPSAVAAPVVTASDPAAASEPVHDTIVVHVSGAVASEGVIELDAGARVIDAVTAAGGARRRAHTEQLNLARVLVDGEQVHVPAAGEQAATAGGAGPGGRGTGAAPGGISDSVAAEAAGPPSPGHIIDLNQATATDLVPLPGIGPVLAERIVAHRTAAGGYRAVEQLLEVDGIGEKTLAALRDHVTV